MGIENKTLEILYLVREKVLSPDEALPHIFSVVGQSEQFVCSDCVNGRDEFEPNWKCPNCEKISKKVIAYAPQNNPNNNVTNLKSI